jgi:alpha-glucosidase
MTIPHDWTGETRTGYHPIGTVRARGDQPERRDGALIWTFASEDGALVEVALLAEDLARVRLLPPDVTPARSWAVVRTSWPEVQVHTEKMERDAGCALKTGSMHLQIHTDPLRLTFSWPDGSTFAEDVPECGMGYVGATGPRDVPSALLPAGSTRCFKRLAPGERILGAGERTEALDKRGLRMIFYNVDPPELHSEKTGSMYASIPFWIGLRLGRAYGIFMDSVRRSDLDAGAAHPDVLSFGTVDGDLTYYVFAGPTPAQVLERYADLTGRTPMPPRWALGYAQSRWGYMSEEHLRSVADEFRRRGIPCDTLYLDIDYMDGYRDFTWNSWRFPDPERMLGELGELGFKVVTIIDPGVKADPTDPTYAEGLERDYFVRRADGSLFVGTVWPGEAVFPDFSRAEVRQWWGERHRLLLDPGIAGIWVDMNEPSLTDRLVPGAGVPHGSTLPPDAVHHPEGQDGPPLAHAQFHNAYGLEMTQATYEGQQQLRPKRRPFVLTRAGYAGIQRYAAVWTGDNNSTWDHLQLAMRMCLTLGLSGVPFVGFDTGGFWGNATGAQLVRFTQLGALFPFFRNHSAMETHAQEPWQFGQPFEAMCRAAIALRYRLLPYIYTAFAQATRDGSPIARAMAYAFPEEDALAPLDDQFLLGDALLAAPVCVEDQIARSVSFPPGIWIDWLTGERFRGPARPTVSTPLDVLPLFVREGAIVPLGPVVPYVGERATEPITLACYLGNEADARAEGTLYEDDGESPAYRDGAYRRTRFTAARSGNTVALKAEASEGGFDGSMPAWAVELSLPHPPRAQVAVDAIELDGESASQWKTVPRRYDTLVRVQLGRLGLPFSVAIRLK